MKRVVKYGGSCLLLLALAHTAVAQMQVGDDLRMNMSGLLTAGYTGNYGDQIPSNHSLTFGADAEINGSYYDPNFLNFFIAPYYNQSRADSSVQSLTDSSGVNATANLFSGSRFPGYASYNYEHNSTGNYGLVGSPNFTTVGDSRGFGVGWSALVPNWPTFSASYSQGSGNGTVFGTNEQSNSSTRTLNLRSGYQIAGWHLNALYQHLNISSKFPTFLSSQANVNFSDSSGNLYGSNGAHALPWNGTIAITFTHSTYTGDYGSTLQANTGISDYSTNTQTTVVNFHPTAKLGLFFNQTYTDNLNGFLYQNIANSGGGVPLVQLDSQSNSSTLSGGANYNFTRNLYLQGQITYYNQSYYGQSYNGSYFTGTLGYGKRILNTFTVSASVIESSNDLANNSLGFLGNLNAFRHFGGWEFNGAFSYAQNVQTYLVTYNTSYYNYNANVHRRLGRGAQWTCAFNGNHSGFTNQPGVTNHSEGFSTALSMRRIDLHANYIKSTGQSVLTSTGIQPIPPTPGFPPFGIIVYDGQSYGAGAAVTPLPRLSISADYSHALSDTLSSTSPSHNRTEIFYSQLQYRLRKISLLAGYTKFLQGISAAGTPPGNQYTYFIGVSRWINFF